jgi:hypothetical protein
LSREFEKSVRRMDSIGVLPASMPFAASPTNAKLAIQIDRRKQAITPVLPSSVAGVITKGLRLGTRLKGQYPHLPVAREWLSVSKRSERLETVIDQEREIAE